MKNLDQIRAKNALAAAKGTAFSGENNGEVVKKVPAQIMQNGLLGALAFALDDKKGYQAVLVSCIRHYKEVSKKQDIPDGLGEFTKWLCERDSLVLRAVTAEFLAYLNYLRRFAKKEEKNSDRGEH